MFPNAHEKAENALQEKLDDTEMRLELIRSPLQEEFDSMAASKLELEADLCKVRARSLR